MDPEQRQMAALEQRQMAALRAAEAGVHAAEADWDRMTRLIVEAEAEAAAAGTGQTLEQVREQRLVLLLIPHRPEPLR